VVPVAVVKAKTRLPGRAQQEPPIKATQAETAPTVVAA
jgi:hypothetical protein